MAEARIQRSGVTGDVVFLREFAELRQGYPTTHRLIEYRREAAGSDWFVRVDADQG